MNKLICCTPGTANNSKRTRCWCVTHHASLTRYLNSVVALSCCTLFRVNKQSSAEKGMFSFCESYKLIRCEADVRSHLDSRPSLSGNLLTGFRVWRSRCSHSFLQQRNMKTFLFNFEHIRVCGVKVRALVCVFKQFKVVWSKGQINPKKEIFLFLMTNFRKCLTLCAVS